ncbi:MAG: YHS domain-containing (seleno)protein [Verrucomicrobiota bacterium]
MSVRASLSLISLFSLLNLIVAQSHAIPFHLVEKDLALQGYDLVSYFDSDEPLKGSKNFEIRHSDIRYRFASQETLEKFKAYPEAYLPTCGGWCAWAMLDSDKTAPNPLSYKFHDGKLLLLYDGFWGDTLKKWNQKAKKEPEDALLTQAQGNWEKLAK